ncbi:MAG: N-formylglutamate amidohydrolase [Thermoguttaceae bacterium]|jgi:N-formylglutamate amidohydrolase|nr:N-formylglutamate amidohydrolase [Thermoguttaceae bacterium]
MEAPAWTIHRGEGPLVAAAIHDGHEVREELASNLAISEAERLREEDPHTGLWTAMAPTRIVVHRSRFEVDLNRSREKSVYLTPQDAWGLEVYREPLPPAILERSYRVYDAFYQEVEALLSGLVERYGRVVVFDVHSYNHRRGGREAQPDAAAANPTINLGTSNMDPLRWGHVADRFEHSMRSVVFRGRPLDVGRNVKFEGGHFVRWIHLAFPQSVCALAVEVKKVFMNEWTGELDEGSHAALGRALAAAGENIVALLSESGMQS